MIKTLLNVLAIALIGIAPMFALAFDSSPPPNWTAHNTNAVFNNINDGFSVQVPEVTARSGPLETSDSA